MSNRRGSISVFPTLSEPIPLIIEESHEVKGIKSIKEDLKQLHEDLGKLKLVKPCRCRCSEIEQKIQKQLDKLSKEIKELIEN
jgi:hypothetical protein